jgi:hypothetical protein
MTKLLLFSLLHFIFYGSNDQLQKTREKYNKANSITYKETAFYPNPDTDEVSSWTTFYLIYYPEKSDFEFSSKSGNTEQFYKNEIFTEVRNDEKSYYRYEEKTNQKEALESSRLKQYGPVSLLSYDWKYVDDTTIGVQKLSHYSVIQDEREYDGKKIKVEFNIYISKDNIISQFERKSYVDNKLGQTITYKFDDYVFDDSKMEVDVAIPEKYALKYFERIETLKPLTINTKAPIFEGIDLCNNKISFKTFPKNKTLLLFSSTNCGASKSVTEFMNQSNLTFDKNIKLITFLESNSIETAKKYNQKYKTNYPVIANRKDIEIEYGIAGYPVMYLIDEKGIIEQTFDGSEEILSYLKKPKN